MTLIQGTKGKDVLEVLSEKSSCGCIICDKQFGEGDEIQVVEEGNLCERESCFAAYAVFKLLPVRTKFDAEMMEDAANE